MSDEKSCVNCRSFPWCCFYLAIPAEIADGKDMCCPLHQPRPEVEKPKKPDYETCNCVGCM